MKKRALSICICLGITMALFAGCGSADQKKAVRENTETIQETGTEALSKLMEKDTEAAEVTESTEASETADLAASGSTAKADTKKETKSGSKSDSGSASQTSASQSAASAGSAKADTTPQAAAPAQPQQTTSAQPAAHEHQWEQYVKDTIQHPETGHYETKVVQAAYDEPQYDWHYICNKCGKDLGTDETTDLIDHEDVCDGSYRSDLVQVGTIHHDAVTEQVWVVDQAAYTEQVYGYRCSCGATK